MPRETIEIVLDELDPYQSGALFFAVLAYPDPRDKNERGRFMQAFVRRTLEQRMELHKDFAQDFQIIRPAYFSGSDREHRAILARGTKRLQGRFAVARFIAMPHFREIDTGRPTRVESLLPTVNNMAVLAALHLKMSEESFTTVKSKIWKPSKPIIHAATAYIVWDEILWEKWGRNPKVDRQLAFLILPEYVGEVAEISEEFRSQLAVIKQFTILEEETIRFTAWQSPNSGRFMQLPRGQD
jgi:hypothetical protein